MVIYHKLNNQRGFTIIELMVALSVLSVLLVLTSITLLQIGKLYAKGINSANVQDSTRNIMNDISGALQFGGADPFACTIYRPPARSSDGTAVAGAPTCAANHGQVAAPWGEIVNIYSYCIGTTRYSYVIDLQLAAQPASGQTYHALWRDTMNNNATCDPLDLTSQSSTGPSDSSTVPNSGSELVPLHMTLTNFFVQESPAGSGLFTINLGLAYGDHDLMEIDPSGKVKCGGGPGQEYCGISLLQTVLTRRLK